jgi:hypothetical protein
MTVGAKPVRGQPVTPPRGFSITVPSNWFEIDVHPDTRNAAINTLVTHRVRQVPELLEHRAALVRALRAAARNAHANGAAFCAAMVEGFDAAVMTASITVSIVRLPDMAAGAGAIQDQLTGIPRRSEDSVWRRVEQAELADIGPVPRTRGVEDLVAPDGAGWIRSAVMQTFVPFPGPEPDRIALVVGTSPILPLENEMFDLFDAITGTFRFRSTPR